MTQQEQTPPHLKRGVIITLIAYLFFAVSSSSVSAFRGKLPTIQIFLVASCIGLLCIAPLTFRKGFKNLKTKFLPLHLLRDLFGMASTFLFFLAIRYLNLVDATILSYTSPFFVPIVWRIWRSEKIQPAVWWSILIGFAGIAIILNPSREIFQLGFVYGLFSGISSAIALSSIRILNLKQEPMSRTTFYLFFFGAFVSLPFAWAVWVPLMLSDWLLCIGIGISLAFGQILLTIAYRYGTASYLSPLSYSIVIYNAVIAYLIYDQSLGLRSIFGTLLIMAGGILTYLLRRKPTTVLETFENSDIAWPIQQ